MLVCFPLGLQPVVQLVARLTAAFFKKLVSAFADEVWHTFNRAATGISTIMERGTVFSLMICFISHINFPAVILLQTLIKFARRGNIFHLPRTQASRRPKCRESPVADRG